MSRLLLVLVVGAALAMMAIGLVLRASAGLERLGRELAVDGLLLLIGLALAQVALALSSLLGLSTPAAWGVRP